VWKEDQREEIEGALRQVEGVTAAEANPLTGNVLVRFNPRATGVDALLDVLRNCCPETPAAQTRTSRLGGLSRVVGAVLLDVVLIATDLGPLQILLEMWTLGSALKPVPEPRLAA
jgi:hypothetical protein